jgi:uncharacterized membrane protein YccC
MGYRTGSRLAVASLVTIAVLSVAGCGGDDDDGGPSKQEFIAQADAICQEGDRKQGAEGVYGENFSDAAFLARHNAVTRDALKRLRALDAPEEDRKAVDDFLSALEASVAALDKRIAALRARDLPEQSQAERDFELSYGNVAASAGALGLSRCQALAN